MEGIFLKRRSKYAYPILGLVMGLASLALACLMLFSGEIRTVEDLLFALVMLCVGLFMMAMCGVSLWINRKVFLHVDDGHISGFSAWRGRLTCDVAQIGEVEAYHGGLGLTICLKNGEEYAFGDLQNWQEIKRFIDARLVCEEMELPDKDDLLLEVRMTRKKRKADILGMALGFGFILIAPLVTALSAGQKELGGLVAWERLALWLVGLLWVASVIAIGIFLRRCSKDSAALDRAERVLHQVILRSAPSLPHEVIQVFFDDRPYASVRTTVYSNPDTGSVYLIVEQIQQDFTLSRIYQSKEYTNMDELMPTLKSCLRRNWDSG